MTEKTVRIQDSVLARGEKKLLVWLASRTPLWMNSDHLTVLGLLAMLGAGIGYWRAGVNREWLWVVNACILINWYGDSLDGTLARVRDVQRPKYGYYVDHIVDALSACFLFGGLGLSGFMTHAVAFALLLSYLLLAIESYLAAYSLGEFRIAHFGFGPTELRILLIVGNCFLFTRPVVDFFGQKRLLFDVGGVIGAAGMFGTLLFAIIVNTTKLYRRETKW